MSQQTINLAEKLSGFTELWSPKIVAGFNGHDVMVVKVNGEFNWHSHPDTDDLFLVLSGRLTIQMRDGDVVLGPDWRLLGAFAATNGTIIVGWTTAMIFVAVQRVYGTAGR